MFYLITMIYCDKNRLLELYIAILRKSVAN